MPPTGTLRGITAMLLACAFFACMDALLKSLAGHYPPVQVMALRGLTALPLVCLYIVWRRETAGVFRRRLRWRLHLLRIALNMTMLVLFVYGLKTLGLAEAYTLTFIAPLLMVLIAVPMLGESVQPRHWIAIGLGFVGVVIALRPEQGAFLSVGALAILVAAVCLRCRTCWAGSSAAPNRAPPWSSGARPAWLWAVACYRRRNGCQSRVSTHGC